MIATLKKLYWYFYYTKRFVVPFNKVGWKLLISAAQTFNEGFPTLTQFGSYLEFTEPLSAEEWRMADEVIRYSHRQTVDSLATFNIFPEDEVRIIRHDGDLYEQPNRRTLGWKQTFMWKPLC